MEAISFEYGCLYLEKHGPFHPITRRYLLLSLLKEAGFRSELL